MVGITTIRQVGFPASAFTACVWENTTMPEIDEILPERIQERLDALGKSKRALSLSIGAHAGYIRDLFDRDRFNVPSALRLQAIAQELETTTDYLIGQADNYAQVTSEISLSDRHLEWRGPTPQDPGIPLVGTGDCGDLELCDTTGQMVEIERTSFDPDFHVRYITRPPALRGALDLYAIYFHGSSMEPKFEAGDVGIVDPRRPAGSGDYVVVQLRDGETESVSSVLVKRLVRQSSKELLLEQFNPALTFTLPRNRVVRVHRILRTGEMMG